MIALRHGLHFKNSNRTQISNPSLPPLRRVQRPHTIRNAMSTIYLFITFMYINLALHTLRVRIQPSALWPKASDYTTPTSLVSLGLEISVLKCSTKETCFMRVSPSVCVSVCVSECTISNGTWSIEYTQAQTHSQTSDRFNIFMAPAQDTWLCRARCKRARSFAQICSKCQEIALPA